MVKLILTNTCRLLLSIVFLFSGFVKLNDPVGMSYKLADYLMAMHIDALNGMTTILAGALGFVEFMLGVYLLLGLSRRITAIITLVFTLCLTLISLYIYSTNAVQDCGCFGDVIHLSHGGTLLKNIILLVAAVIVLRGCKEEIKLLFGCLGWLSGLVIEVVALCYVVWCWLTLPVIDFSLYREGTDMMEKVSLKDAPEVMVERYVANDFYLQDSLGEDITAQVMAQDEAYLIIAPDIKETNQGSMTEVNDLYEEAQEKNAGFYFITASSKEDWERYCYETSTSYPMYKGDERVLKTVVRANPGLVVLKKGVIEKKRKL